MRLHALISTTKYRDDRGAAFSTFLTTYLRCRVTDYLNVFYAKCRTPFSVVPLKGDLEGTPRDLLFSQELDGLKSSLTPYTRDLLNRVFEENAPGLRRKLIQGRAFSEIRGIAGGDLLQVKGALSEIRRQAERHLSCI